MKHPAQNKIGHRWVMACIFAAVLGPAMGALSQKVVDEMGVSHLPDAAFYEGFEFPADHGWRVGVNDATDPHRKYSPSQLLQLPDSPMSLSSEHARNGKQSLKVEVLNTNHNFRTELARGYVPMGSKTGMGSASLSRRIGS